MAPVLVFGYKREDTLKQTLEALNKNNSACKTDLFIFIDGPRDNSDIEKVEKVQKLVDDFCANNSFKSVTVEQSINNKGLAVSIINGVSKIIDNYESVIVVEDDLVTSEDFIDYMNSALDYYRDDDDVGAISGFSLKLDKKSDNNDLYIAQTGNSWGWATWKNIWVKTDWEVTSYFDTMLSGSKRNRFEMQQYGIAKMLDMQMEGKIDSWAVRWDYSFFERKLKTIYPYDSKVRNIGFGIDATNTLNSIDKRNDVVELKKNISFKPSYELADRTSDLFKGSKPSIYERLVYMMAKWRKK